MMGGPKESNGAYFFPINLDFGVKKLHFPGSDFWPIPLKLKNGPDTEVF